MTRTRSVFGLGFAFVLGCAVAPMAQQYVVRPAGAAPEGVRRWEQYCTHQLSDYMSHFGNLNDKVNADVKARGLEGFELVAGSATIEKQQTEFIYCFKRPLP